MFDDTFTDTFPDEAAVTSPWAPIPGVVNVRDYGATGNGTTDDTLPINLAIWSVPASGGTVYFPPGTYLTGGGHQVDYPCALVGAGAGYDTPGLAITRIVCTSPTASLFQLNAHGSKVADMALVCAAPNPTAGAGVTVTAGDVTRFQAISVLGFYNGIDVQDGDAWTMHACRIGNPVKYGLKINHLDLPDGGDMAISDSTFWTTRAADAAIRIESGGGARIVNCKINSGNGPQFVDGISVRMMDGAGTAILMVSNTSIENCSRNGVNATTGTNSVYNVMVFNGVQFGLYTSVSPAIYIAPPTLGLIRHVSVTGCVFQGVLNAGQAAVNLTRVDNAVVARSPLVGYIRLLDTVGCTNVLTI